MSSLARACLLALAVASPQAATAGGVISGVVAYAGAAPRAERLDRSADPICARTAASDQSLVLSKDGKGLGNVVVRVVKGAPDTRPPAEPLTVDQRDCMFVPHVQAGVEGQ